VTFYPYALFLHVVGAIGVFVALGLEWVAVVQLGKATSNPQLREWLKLYGVLPWIGGPGIAFVLLFGLHMVAVSWGPIAWAMVALGTLIIYSSLAGVVNSRRIPALRRAVADGLGPDANELRPLLQSPRPLIVLYVRTGLILGIVFLMTVKPDLVGSLIAVVAGAVLGLAASLPHAARARAHQPAA
jgi:hypothetical protein